MDEYRDFRGRELTSKITSLLTTRSATDETAELVFGESVEKPNTLQISLFAE